METNDLTYYDYLQSAKISDKFFHSIMEGFPQGIIIVNTEDEIIYANFKMAQLTGYSRRELQGKISHSFLHYPDEQEKLKTIMRLRITGIYETYELYIRRKNGSRFLAHTITAPYKDDSGSIKGTISLISDHSVLKREAELEALALGATKSLNAVLIIDKYGKIEWINEGFTKLSGYQLYEIIDTNGELFRKEQTKFFLQKLSESVKEKAPKIFECRNYHKSGSKYWVQCTLTPIIDEHSSVREIVVTETDITEHKSITEELSLVNTKMANSIQQRNTMLAELEKAKVQIEQDAEDKKDLLKSIHTEVQAPVSNMIGLISLLSQTSLTAEQEKYLTALKTSADVLKLFIQDIQERSATKRTSDAT
jgi:PAS domain S-box-containing protein